MISKIIKNNTQKFLNEIRSIKRRKLRRDNEILVSTGMTKNLGLGRVFR